MQVFNNNLLSPIAHSKGETPTQQDIDLSEYFNSFDENQRLNASKAAKLNGNNYRKTKKIFLTLSRQGQLKSKVTIAGKKFFYTNNKPISPRDVAEAKRY